MDNFVFKFEDLRDSDIEDTIFKHSNDLFFPRVKRQVNCGLARAENLVTKSINTAISLDDKQVVNNVYIDVFSCKSRHVEIHPDLVLVLIGVPWSAHCNSVR